MNGPYRKLAPPKNKDIHPAQSKKKIDWLYVASAIYTTILLPPLLIFLIIQYFIAILGLTLPIVISFLATILMIEGVAFLALEYMQNNSLRKDVS